MHIAVIAIKSAFNKNQNYYYYKALLEKCLCKQYKKLYYERINVSEGFNVSKTSDSKEYIICHYWYFLDKGHKFQVDPPAFLMIY